MLLSTTIGNRDGSKTSIKPITHYQRSLRHLSKPSQFVHAAKLHDLDPMAALRMRQRYLKEQTEVFWHLLLSYQDVDPFLWWYMDHYMALEEIGLYMANYEPIDRKDEITEGMIESAREYPVDSLIEFIRGKVTCPFHDDKNPSAYHGTRSNRLICPVCNQTWDSISIQQHLTGQSFPEAVRSLCR